MSVKISATFLESFVGDVRPIWLISDTNLKNEPIKWKIAGDAVKMRSFNTCGHGSFNYGILLTFIQEGEACVSAKYGDEEFFCRALWSMQG